MKRVNVSLGLVVITAALASAQENVTSCQFTRGRQSNHQQWRLGLISVRSTNAVWEV